MSTNMKYILIILLLLSTTGCVSLRTPVENQAGIDAMNIAANGGNPPTMFLGMKLYPHAAAKILMTPPASLSGGGTSVTVTSHTYTRGNTTTTYYNVYGGRR